MPDHRPVPRRLVRRGRRTGGPWRAGWCALAAPVLHVHPLVTVCRGTGHHPLSVAFSRVEAGRPAVVETRSQARWLLVALGCSGPVADELLAAAEVGPNRYGLAVTDRLLVEAEIPGPEVEMPEAGRPEVDRPEVDRPGIETPEVEK